MLHYNVNKVKIYTEILKHRKTFMLSAIWVDNLKLYLFWKQLYLELVIFLYFKNMLVTK